MASRTADFFENGTVPQFEWVLTKYDETLKAKADSKNSKADTLLKLDKWFQNELPKKIKSRGKEAHLTHDELVQTIKWKLARGKFRPRLKDMIQMNTPRVVKQETSKAFRNLFKRNDLEASVSALCNLKGVGPAMASAVLAAAAPEMAPFMADECLLSMPDIEGIDYTMKEYMKYVEKTRQCVERLNASSEGNTWTPHRVELAVWTHYVAYDLKPELLNDLPPRHPLPPINGEDAEDAAVTDTNGAEAGAGETNGLNGTATPVSEVSSVASESDSNSCPAPESLPETPPEASFAASESSFVASESAFVAASEPASTAAAAGETSLTEMTTEKERTEAGAVEAVQENLPVEAVQENPPEEAVQENLPESVPSEEVTKETPVVVSEEAAPVEEVVKNVEVIPKDAVETVESKEPEAVGEKQENSEVKEDPPTNGVSTTEVTKESSDSESTNDSVPPQQQPSLQTNDIPAPQKIPPSDLPESLPPTKRPAEEDEEEAAHQVKRMREDSEVVMEASQEPVAMAALSANPPVIHAGGD